jgi:hypothetical protein
MSHAVVFLQLTEGVSVQGTCPGMCVLLCGCVLTVCAVEW